MLDSHLLSVSSLSVIRSPEYWTVTLDPCEAAVVCTERAGVEEHQCRGSAGDNVAHSDVQDPVTQKSVHVQSFTTRSAGSIVLNADPKSTDECSYGSGGRAAFRGKAVASSVERMPRFENCSEYSGNTESLISFSSLLLSEDAVRATPE